jgi:hypothetical protein
MKTIELDDEQETHLTILLNIELRDRNLSDEYRLTLNGIFKQLAGRDHESIQWAGLDVEAER